MMIAFLRKDFTRLTSILYSNNVCKSPAYFSIYFKNFSSEPDITIHRISEILVLEHNFDPQFVSRVAPKLSDLKKPENTCSTLSFLKESGFPDNRLEKIVKYRRAGVLSASLEDSIKPKFKFFQEMGLSSDGISKMISGTPQILSASLVNVIKPKINFFREMGISSDCVSKMIMRCPQLLTVSLEDNIKPKINFFREMGLSSNCISKMISGNPVILGLSLNDNIIPSVALLKQLLGSNDAVAKFIQKAPRFLLYNFENTVLPSIEFFKGLGVPLEQVRTVLMGYPGCFLYKLEVLKKSAEIAKEMGVDATSKTFVYAVTVLVCSSNEGWKLKLQAMQSLGFSHSDILIIFRKAPLVFMISVEKMKMIIKLLLDTKKYTMSSVVECPLSLQSSIEKRYMPRLHILGILESRNLIQDWPRLSKLCKSTDDKFSKEFVIPYSDKVGAVCSVDNSATGEED